VDILPDTPPPGVLLLLYPRGESPIIDRAEETLLAFGTRTRDTAARLLDSWRHRVELTDRERAATLARFPRPRHVTRWTLTRGGVMDARCSCQPWAGA